MNITNKIKFYREKERLTQKALAKKSNISERQIIKIENDELDPRTSTSLKIASSLNTTVEELFKLPSENSSSEKILHK